MAHSSKNISLSEYLEDVDKGNIMIPEFQRDFVWTKAKMLKLASSLLKGYPIGSFLLMQDTGEYASRPVEGLFHEDSSSLIDETPCQNENNIQSTNPNGLLILDGQQRTTSAYQIFYGKGKYKFYFNYKQFVEDTKDADNNSITSIIEDIIEDWLVALPLEKAINSPDEQRTKGYFPLDIILNRNNNQDYSQWLDIYSTSNALGVNYQLDIDKHAKLSKCKSFFIRKLIESVTSYQASEIIIDKNTSTNIVCTIFETINSTGQKLTIFDLLNAKCFPSGFKLRSELENAFENNEIFCDYDTDKNSLIGISLIKTIGLLSKKSCKKSDLLALKPYDIQHYWNVAVNYTSLALTYIKNNYGILGLKYFPYKDILPVISTVVNDVKFLDNNDNCKTKLNKWYWHCVFTGYFDNATESKSNKAIKDLLGTEKDKGWFDDDILVPEVVKNNQLLNFDNLNNLSSNQSAQYKAILNLITLNDIQDFSTSRTKIITLKDSQLNDHHIFPKKFLTLYNIKGNKANTILNRTLISEESNLKIKDKSPSAYLRDKKIIGNEFSSQELLRHCIHKDIIFNTFTEQSFEDFKAKRKQLIIELIKLHL